MVNPIKTQLGLGQLWVGLWAIGQQALPSKGMGGSIGGQQLGEGPGKVGWLALPVIGIGAPIRGGAGWREGLWANGGSWD